MRKKLNLFIFANSYLAKTAAYMLDYVLDISGLTVLLLKENHSEDEFPFSLYGKIMLHEDIDSCIANSDAILIIKDDYLHQKSIDYIVETSKKIGKEYLIVDNAWGENIPKSNNAHDNFKSKEIFDFNNIPTILLIGCSMVSQQYCTEILLNKLLTNKKISFKQVYSNETAKFLSRLNKWGLNRSISLGIEKNEYNKQLDVIVVSMNIGENINDIRYHTALINNMRPDFIILQTNCGFNEYENIYNIFKYGVFTPLDIIVKSRYYSMDRFDVCCKTKPADTPFFKYVDEVDIEKHLSFLILSKISLPDGVISL